jgi:hypothetical protein
MICMYVEVKDKLIVPKLDNFFKHVGRQKCKVSMLGVDAGSCCMNMNYVHSKNERQSTTSQRPYVLDLL